MSCDNIIADMHGTFWDSIYTVSSVEGSTELNLSMDANAYKFLAKLMNPITKNVIKKTLEKDIDAVKIYCEK